MGKRKRWNKSQPTTHAVSEWPTRTADIQRTVLPFRINTGRADQRKRMADNRYRTNGWRSRRNSNTYTEAG